MARRHSSIERVWVRDLRYKGRFVYLRKKRDFNQSPGSSPTGRVGQFGRFLSSKTRDGEEAKMRLRRILFTQRAIEFPHEDLHLSRKAFWVVIDAGGSLDEAIRAWRKR